MMRSLLGGLVLLAATAHASDQVTWQSRILDSGGTPIEGPVSLTLAIYAAAEATEPLATEPFAAVAEGGYVNVVLSSALSAHLATDAPRFIEVSVGGTPLGGRHPVGAVPSALVASRVVITSDVGTCDATAEGQIRWDTTQSTLRVCVAGSWQSVSASAAGGPGSTAGNAISSCAEAPTSGKFWVTFGSQTRQAYCDPGQGWVHVLDYYDDNAINDLPDSPPGVAIGFQNENALYIGNNALNAIPFDEAEWCTSNGTNTHCFPITDADWGFRLGNVDSLIGPKRRIIAAFSGQIPDGTTEDVANGDFYTTNLATKPPVCNGADYPTNPGSGRIGQWSGDDADWHTWGNGLSLYLNGSNVYGVNNEVAWGAENLTAGRCGPEWEHFYVRVKPLTAGAPGSNSISPAASCAAVSSATPGAQNGFFWIDPDGGDARNAGRVWCDFTGGWTHVVHYLDDNSKNDLPDSRWVIAQGFASPNASYVGNEALNAMAFTEAQWCTSDLSSTACFPIADSDFTYTGNDVNGLVGGKRRSIAALSGQVDDGRTEDGAAGDFYATRTAVAPPICTGPGYTAVNTSHGHIRQWSGSDADWHTWGNGLSLYKNGSATYGVHNELAWGAENLSPTTFCGPERELFYIRVR